MLVLAIMTIAVLGVILLSWRKRVRDRHFLAAAAALQLSATTHKDPDLPLMHHQGLLERGEIAPIAKGTWNGLDVCAFNHERRFGKSTTVQTAVAFRRPDATLPAFQLRPRRFRDSLVPRLFRGDLVEPAGVPGFSQRYVLHSTMPGATLAFFSPEVCAWFAQLPPNSFVIETGGDRLLIYTPAARVKPKHLQSFLTAAGNVAAGVLTFGSSWQSPAAAGVA